MAQRMFGDKVIPWIAASKSSDQKGKISQPKNMSCIMSADCDIIYCVIAL